MAKPDPLAHYKAKRNFSKTPEPDHEGSTNTGQPAFVIQKHWASTLHYDFRLEINGTMKSWAIPKGPSLDPSVKRMAVQVEDHPVSYSQFEGEIPSGQYGAGKVIIWDKGSWESFGDPEKGYICGKLDFALRGYKLQGRWALVRMAGKQGKQQPWLLIKKQDAYARAANEFSVVDELPEGVYSQAKRSSLPATLPPQLATLVDTPPTDAQGWIYEIKFDGYRLLTRIDQTVPRLYTRNGHDWTDRLLPLQAALKKMKLPDGWYDGEIVVLDENGLPNFQALQSALDHIEHSEIVYFLFDLPYCDGKDHRADPLWARREKLQALLQTRTPSVTQGPVRFSTAFDANVRDIYGSACRMGLEGIMGKRKDSPYRTKRSGDWIKLKCTLRQEFVIGGFTEPKGTRVGLGALLLGVHDETGELRYAGNVGSGFTDRILKDIRRKLETLTAAKSPFSNATGSYCQVHWVQPSLLAEVSFAEWTRDGHIRHAVFHGLRTDKPAKAIVRESSMPTPGKPPSSQQHTLLNTLKITHPERIVDETTGVTKIEVMRYYALIAPLIMLHLKARPVSLVRAPDGVSGQMFFQKHMDTSGMKGLRPLPTRLDPEHDPLLEVALPQGLISAAQMNVLEFHTWNASKTNISKPDRLIFDLDPGKGVGWPAMQEAALVLRAFLQELELESFVKTSGGKGLHVVVPMQRRLEWDTVKAFAQAVVNHMARTLPRRFSSKSGPRNRIGKIFIDYLRNGFGATTVSAWSLRARPGMGISVPIAWAEVEKISSSAHWHIRNIHERLDVGNNPWADYAKTSQTLTQAMRILGQPI